MSKVTIVVEDPRGFEAGSISIMSRAFDRLIGGHRLRFELGAITTPGGTPFSSEAAGMPERNRYETIMIESEVDVFGGAKSKWRFRTDARGASIIRRMQEREDAELFRYWAGEMSAGRLSALSLSSGAGTPDTYRAALAAMKRSGTKVPSAARAT